MKRAPVTAGFLAILLALGVTDAFVTGSSVQVPAYAYTDPPQVDPVGVPPKRDPDVSEVLAELNISQTDAKEQSFLSRIIQTGPVVTTKVLIKDADRVALLSYVDTPESKTYFNSLKKVLFSSFSNDMTDLLDTTSTQAGKPVQNVLRFRDPSISEELLLFVRVRERLYEFHVASEKDAIVNEILELLTN